MVLQLIDVAAEQPDIMSRILLDSAVRDQAKEVLADARPQAQK